MDPGFLAILDMGAHGKDNKSRVVSEYEHRWWSGRKPRDLGTMQILNTSTLSTCLDHYREQFPSQTNTTIGISVSAGAGACSPARTDAPSTAGTSVPPTAGTSVLASAGAGDNACQRCSQYRDVLSDVLQDVLKFCNLSSGMAASSETQWKLGLRWASTFHLLQEAALMKETSGCAPPASGTTAYQIENVAWKASSELSRLQSMPATSYKWTWGETLTKKEVLALCQTGTQPGAVPHSGYDLSLVEGRMLGEYTVDSPSHPTSYGQNENVPTEAVFVPPNSELGIPACLSRHGCLSYNPLGRSASSIEKFVSHSPLMSITPLDPQQLVMDLTNISVSTPAGHEPPAPALSLADIWTDSDASVTEGLAETEAAALGLADIWSDTESSGAEASPPAPASALLLAEDWSDNDDAASAEVSQNPATTAFLLAEQWQDIDEVSREGSPPAPAPALMYSSGTLGSDSEHSNMSNDDRGSSAYTYGSQLVISPSWITLKPSGPTFLDMDAHFPLSNNVALADTPISTPACAYGPEHFAYLQDHLFDDSSDEEED
ncbi:hypothetical protein BYT27DRAFT_7258861 [Phlegmacium glaucopus]|nr:hypothetical protein BYT27DRAFT_7258861 [Phlegmacium glaucopus]